MIRRFGSGKLRSAVKKSEDINPMDGVGNMADAMLILAVGIMLALVINWNVDISTGSPISVDNTTEVESMNKLKGDNANEAADAEGLTEMGKVYQDPKTGKMYMIERSKQ